MKLSDLKNKEIKNVFYLDEAGGIGIEDKSKDFHLVEYGSIFFEMIDNSLIEIVNDGENGGILPSHIENSNIHDLLENKIQNDAIWSKISNKLISRIKIHTDYLLKETLGETKKTELISTLELSFKNGEKVFISNGGYREKGKITSMTDDFIIYRKKATGLKLNLIKEA